MPGRGSMFLYCPWPSVTAVLVLSISTSLLASTVTPGSTAPVESLTMPAIVLWARAGSGAITMQTIDKKRDAARGDLLMTPPEGSRSETDGTAGNCRLPPHLRTGQDYSDIQIFVYGAASNAG